MCVYLIIVLVLLLSLSNLFILLYGGNLLSLNVSINKNLPPMLNQMIQLTLLHDIDKGKEIEEIEEIEEIPINRPNILFIFPDQLRFDWIDDHYYPNQLDINTPNIKKLQLNGIRFMNVISASPTCVPSRATLAAGMMNYDKLGQKHNGMNWPPPFRYNSTAEYKNVINKPSDNGHIFTFYKYLQLYGYHTMTTGKDDLTKQHGVGIDGRYLINELGFSDGRRCHGKLDVDTKYPKTLDPYAKYLDGTDDAKIQHNCYAMCDGHDQICPKPCDLHNDLSYQDNYITSTTLDILESTRNYKDKPWFLQVNYAGPHDPFMITKSMYDLNEKLYPNKSRLIPSIKKYPEIDYEKKAKHKNMENIRMSRELYTIEIENLDVLIGKLIDKLYEMKQYNNTIICISSDHGDMMGDGDQFGKFSPWSASTNVPLICSGPNIKKNIYIKTIVSLIDLAATFLEYGGMIDSQRPSYMDSISLIPFLNGTWDDNYNKYNRKYYSSGLGEWRLVIKEINSNIWKLICCRKQCNNPRYSTALKTIDHQYILLFNVKYDLYEQTNLVDKYPEVINEMRQYLPKGFCDQ